MPRVKRYSSKKRSARRTSTRKLRQKSRKQSLTQGGDVLMQRRFSDPETCRRRIEDLKSAIWRLEIDKQSVQSVDSIQAIEAQIHDLKVRIQALQDGRV